MGGEGEDWVGGDGREGRGLGEKRWNRQGGREKGMRISDSFPMEYILFAIESLYFIPSKTRTPLYTVEHLYFNSLKYGHLSIKDTWICPY